MNELEELSSSEEKQSLARILVNCVLEEAVKRVTTPCGPGDEYQLQMELQQSLESRHEVRVVICACNMRLTIFMGGSTQVGVALF